MLKKISLVTMAVLYVVAGINHFIHPETYMKIMPSYLPWHSFLVSISGVIEIGLGLLLIPNRTRRFAVWGIIALLIAVFPANIQMALDYYHSHNPNLWIAILRLPIQVLLIWWAYIYRNYRLA
ncbi:MAG: MauE/DoxX family redox-associated membrane protein [Ginsengibacter sp.]